MVVLARADRGGGDELLVPERGLAPAVGVSVARQHGGTAFPRPGPKGRERADIKVAEKEGDASQLLDLAGARVEFDTVDQVYQALDDLSRNPDVTIVRAKDRLAGKPQESGYGDVLLNLRTPDGHIGELRLQLSQMQRVDAFEHGLYEVSRNIEDTASIEGRPLTPEEKALVSELNRRSNAYYQQALDQATR